MKATEQYFPVVLFIMLYKVAQCNFWVCEWNPKVWPFKKKLPSMSSPFRWCCFYAVQGGTFESKWNLKV